MVNKHMSEENKAVLKISPVDHDKFTSRVQRGNEDQAEAFHKLLCESEWLPKLDSTLEEATVKFNEFQENASRSALGLEAGNLLLGTLKSYVEYLRERSK